MASVTYVLLQRDGLHCAAASIGSIALAWVTLKLTKYRVSIPNIQRTDGELEVHDGDKDHKWKGVVHRSEEEEDTIQELRGVRRNLSNTRICVPSPSSFFRSSLEP